MSYPDQKPAAKRKLHQESVETGKDLKGILGQTKIRWKHPVAWKLGAIVEASAFEPNLSTYLKRVEGR